MRVRRAGPWSGDGLAGWYRRLLAAVAGHRVRTGTWRLLEAAGWPDNQSCRSLLAWSWAAAAGTAARRRHVIVVNLSTRPAQGRVTLPWADLPGRGWRLTDLLTGEEFERDGGELAGTGLFVAMRPGQCYLLAVDDGADGGGS